MTNKMLGVPGYDVDETSLFVRRTLTAVMTNASIILHLPDSDRRIVAEIFA